MNKYFLGLALIFSFVLAACTGGVEPTKKTTKLPMKQQKM